MIKSLKQLDDKHITIIEKALIEYRRILKSEVTNYIHRLHLEDTILNDIDKKRINDIIDSKVEYIMEINNIFLGNEPINK